MPCTWLFFGCQSRIFLVHCVLCLLTLAKPPMKRALFRGVCENAPHPMRHCASEPTRIGCLGNDTPGVVVDRRLTGHLKPRGTCACLLGKGHQVERFQERPPFLEQRSPMGGVVGSFMLSFPGRSVVAAVPGSSRENTLAQQAQTMPIQN